MLIDKIMHLQLPSGEKAILALLHICSLSYLFTVPLDQLVASFRNFRNTYPNWFPYA